VSCFQGSSSSGSSSSNPRRTSPPPIQLCKSSSSTASITLRGTPGAISTAISRLLTAPALQLMVQIPGLNTITINQNGVDASRPTLTIPGGWTALAPGLQTLDISGFCSVGLPDNLSVQTLRLSGSNGVANCRQQPLLPLPSLTGYSNLARLTLTSLNARGSVPEGWAVLTALQSASITTMPAVTGNLPTSWASTLSALTRLTISGTSLSGSIPSEFGSFAALQELRLNNNVLLGSLPQTLDDLSDTLMVLDVSRQPLAGCVPPQLFSKVSSRALSLSTYRTSINRRSCR